MNSFFRRISWQSIRKGQPSARETQSAHQEGASVEPSPIPTPKTQTVLLLIAAKQPYQLTERYDVPELGGEYEVLVRTEAIGLNPIDWKAPDFNFAIPTLPYISGRELAGEVVQKPSHTNTRLKARDRVRPHPVLVGLLSHLLRLQATDRLEYPGTSNINRLPGSAESRVPGVCRCVRLQHGPAPAEHVIGRGRNPGRCLCSSCSCPGRVHGSRLLQRT